MHTNAAAHCDDTTRQIQRHCLSIALDSSEVDLARCTGMASNRPRFLGVDETRRSGAVTTSKISVYLCRRVMDLAKCELPCTSALLRCASKCALSWGVCSETAHHWLLLLAYTDHGSPSPCFLIAETRLPRIGRQLMQHSVCCCHGCGCRCTGHAVPKSRCYYGTPSPRSRDISSVTSEMLDSCWLQNCPSSCLLSIFISAGFGCISGTLLGPPQAAHTVQGRSSGRAGWTAATTSVAAATHQRAAYCRVQDIRRAWGSDQGRVHEQTCVGQALCDDSLYSGWEHAVCSATCSNRLTICCLSLTWRSGL